MLSSGLAETARTQRITYVHTAKYPVTFIEYKMYNVSEFVIPIICDDVHHIIDYIVCIHLCV